MTEGNPYFTKELLFQYNLCISIFYDSAMLECRDSIDSLLAGCKM
jgi:hypothetical protein